MFDRALALTVGEAPVSRVTMGGKTDPQIVREYLELMELDDVDDRLASVLGHLERELAASAGSWSRPG